MISSESEKQCDNCPNCNQPGADEGPNVIMGGVPNSKYLYCDTYSCPVVMFDPDNI